MENQLLDVKDIKGMILDNCNVLNDSIIVGRWRFGDFVRNNNTLSSDFINILHSFDFEVVYTENYHYAFCNSTYITIHQLNYGISIPDLSSEGDIYDKLNERIEFSSNNFKDEEEKSELLDLFCEIVDMFYTASNEIITEM